MEKMYVYPLIKRVNLSAPSGEYVYENRRINMLTVTMYNHHSFKSSGGDYYPSIKFTLPTGQIQEWIFETKEERDSAIANIDELFVTVV